MLLCITKVFQFISLKPQSNWLPYPHYYKLQLSNALFLLFQLLYSSLVTHSILVKKTKQRKTDLEGPISTNVTVNVHIRTPQPISDQRNDI